MIEVTRILLAVVFAVAGVAKLLDLDGSRQAVAGFGVRDRLARPLGLALPVAELSIAAGLLFTASARYAAAAAAALLVAFCVAIAFARARGRTPSYTFPNGWFSKTSKGSPKRGRNCFFGGTTTAAVSAKATIGKQTVKLPAAAAGRKATLSGWLGNYGTVPGANLTQVRAQFADATGKVLATVRIGPDTTISGTDMAFRSRKGTVPRGATQVTIVVTFSGGNNYKLAGADDLSLVLA